MRKILITAALLAVCRCGFSVNLIVNGDFESGPIAGHFLYGYPQGWEGVSVDGWHHSDPGYHKGSYGIAIWNNGTLLEQFLDSGPARRYTLTAEMIYHTTEVLVNKRAYLRAQFWQGSYPDGTLLGEDDAGQLTPSHSSGQWYKFSKTITTPAGTDQFRIICSTERINANLPSSGKAYWDNVAVEDQTVINDPDYNGDLTVNILDFALLAAGWLQVDADVNLAGGNFIDGEDLSVLADNWLARFPEYELVWADEFNAAQLDTDAWTHDIGTGDWGWGNGEWQYYTARPENIRLQDGRLIIEARKENYGGCSYTSARIKTQGKKSFQYGRIEALIKMPTGGNGIWPAFWMLGNNITSVGWPACGEIDIVEMMEDPYTASGALHYGSSDQHRYQSGYDTTAGNLSSDYHVFAIEWEPTEIRWYRDDVNYFTATQWWSSTGEYPAPFNQQFYVLLNFAVGAHWAVEDPDVTFPQQLMVDYVRVYRKR
jgi:beta-glucanase (GH16 family)